MSTQLIEILSCKNSRLVFRFSQLHVPYADCVFTKCFDESCVNSEKNFNSLYKLVGMSGGRQTIRDPFLHCDILLAGNKL